jgi:PAS domain S-box-containing protein
VRSVSGNPRFAPWSGLCVAAFGLLIAVAWYAQWSDVFQLVPGLAPMKFNTALCFVLFGLALTSLTTRHPTAALALAGVATTIGLISLGEHVCGRSAGIDQLWALDYLAPLSEAPGRMSPHTAIAFVLLGTGLMLSTPHNPAAWRLAVVGLMACLVCIIAVVSAGGYLLGVERAVGWGGATRTALPTAAGLLVLGLSLFAWVWHTLQRQQSSLAPWLPLAGPLTLMFTVVMLSALSLAQLNVSFKLRVAAYETLVSAQALLNGFIDTQRGMHGYALTGQQKELETYRRGVEAAPKALAELAALTRDNAAQRALVRDLAGDLGQVVDYSHRLLAARDTFGRQAAVALESTGEDQSAVVNRPFADLQQLIDQIHQLLLERDTQTRENFRNTMLLLILAIVVAAILLAHAQITAVRELVIRRRTEAALSELSVFQAGILNSANYAIVSMSIDGTVTTFNDTAGRWLQHAPADIVGKTTPALWHDPAEVVARAVALSHELGHPVTAGFEAFAAKARRGFVDENEWTLIRKDGSRFPVLLSTSALTDGNGNVTGYLSMLADITGRKQQEAAVRLSEERFRRAFDDAPAGMALVSPQIGWLRVNRALCEMLGHDEAGLLATDLQSILHPADVGADQAYWRKILDGTLETHEIEKRCLHRDGHFIWMSFSASLLRDAEGKALHFVVQIKDLTERNEAIARAENANAAKSQFLANMSHEIRTPLNAVIGLGYLLEQTPLNLEQRAFLAKIQFAGRTLLSVVNNVLDLSKIEAGEMPLEEAAFDLISLTTQIGQMLSPQAQAKGIELRLRPAANLPRWVRGDATRLSQIVTNLLNNAIKFTAGGHVELQLSCVEQAAGIRLRCAVRDTGIGISADGVARLFAPFAQADASTTRRFGGTGLGLSIARRLAELMGGDIGVTSTVGVGSEFWVEIPLQIADESDVLLTAHVARPVRVLIVETQATQALSAISRPLGWLPSSVEDAEAAIARLRRGDGDAWPDAIIVDGTLQGLHLVTFLSRLRREFSHLELPPIIVVDDELKSHRQHPSVQQMASVVLAQPVTSSSVFNAVNSALVMRNSDHHSALQATHADQAVSQWLSGAQILVVDDSEINRSVAQSILQKQGATVTTCCSGIEAVERLRQQPDAFDIVLMDVQMPELDGNEATVRIRNELRLETLPIIALTANALASERERSLQAGMSDFLSKPLEPALLIRVVRRFVEVKRGAPLPVVILDTHSHQTSVAVGLVSVDPKFVHQMFGDDEELFVSLLGRLLSDFGEFAGPGDLDHLSDAAARKQLIEKLHKLRGSAGTIGAKLVQRLAGAAERALVEGEPREFVAAVLRQLASAFTALGDEVEPLLDMAAAKLRAAAATAIPVTGLRITELADLLDAQNLEAIDQFNEAAPALSVALGKARFEHLKDAIERLDFALAARLLRVKWDLPQVSPT